jgi:hypothetical protein
MCLNYGQRYAYVIIYAPFSFKVKFANFRPNRKLPLLNLGREQLPLSYIGTNRALMT